MRVVIDIEANSLGNPTKVWLIVLRDIDTGELHVFRPETEVHDRTRWEEVSKQINYWIGHNILNYDLPVLVQLGFLRGLPDAAVCCDTLVVSRLCNYSRLPGHSLASYGEEFGLAKIDFNDWTKYTPEMEAYCVRDVDINLRVYLKFRDTIHSPDWHRSIQLEQEFQRDVVNALHKHGFAFDGSKASKLLHKVVTELGELDEAIHQAFPPVLRKVREISPRLTAHGTLHKGDFRWVKGGDLSEFNGGPFTRCEWAAFNPSSHKQIVSVLSAAGWSPVDKTTTHSDVIKEIGRVKYHPKTPENELHLQELNDKLRLLERTGWKVNETNLDTLPVNAPKPARLLAKRILLESRRRTLTEWLSLVDESSSRIHGQFQGIGAWTHRMSHQRPNTANIPNEHDINGKTKLLGKEMRQLWIAPKKKLLVGVDAEGIQLRIFAHYINDEEFTNALVAGQKADKTDPHSLNQKILGSVCKSRASAKRFIYALLLGAGIGKLTQILECSEHECKEALNRLLQRYTGWKKLKEEDIPRDAQAGYFTGLDMRKVSIPGTTRSERSHLCMSGYLQNGEAVVMKMATLKWMKWIKEDPEMKGVLLVDLVHDEWQTEFPSKSVDKAVKLAEYQCRALKETGEELGLLCPLAGSFWNDDHGDYTIGTNWYQTH